VVSGIAEALEALMLWMPCSPSHTKGGHAVYCTAPARPQCPDLQSRDEAVLAHTAAGGDVDRARLVNTVPSSLLLLPAAATQCSIWLLAWVILPT
jgi:hypothetical protein